MTLITVTLAYPVAYFLAFKVRKNPITWLILLSLPFWTSYLLRVLAWKIMLGNSGIINSTLMELGFLEGPLEFLLYSRFAVVLTLAHGWAAFAILPIYVSLSKIDRSLLEAAADLGESPVRTFFRVTLPLSMPGVIVAAVIQFIPTVGDYITPMMVGGPRGNHVRPDHRRAVRRRLQLAAGRGADDHDDADHYAHRVGLHLAFAVGNGAPTRNGIRRGNQSEPAVAGERRRIGPLHVYMGFYLLFLYIPSLMLPVFSFNDSIQMVLPLKEFTLKWYQGIPNTPGLMEALGNSLKVAHLGLDRDDDASDARCQGAHAVPAAGAGRRVGVHHAADGDAGHHPGSRHLGAAAGGRASRCRCGRSASRTSWRRCRSRPW